MKKRFYKGVELNHTFVRNVLQGGSILLDYIRTWKGLHLTTADEPNSPFILIPIFFIIKRVPKKLTSINPPIAPSRDAGNGSNRAEMNPIVRTILILIIYSLSNVISNIPFL